MIEVKNLTKCFGKNVAVNDISFTVDRGEVLGFLGPNAAGKSTTMRMITGFLPPTSGTAVIGGADIIRDSLRARQKIGYLPENAPAYPEMTAQGFLEFVAEVRGFTGRDKRRRVAETIERCFLEDVRFQPIGTLSKGFKQRVCFAQSILHDPEYLVMDEPTDGLDPNQKHEVRMMIRDMAHDKTILLSTHILEEVDAVCTRAIIIAQGRIVLDDTPAGLKARSPAHGGVCVRVQKRVEQDVVRDLQPLPGVARVVLVEESASTLTVRIHPRAVEPGRTLAGEVIRDLGGRGWIVESIHVEEGRLDEVFRMVTAQASAGSPTRARMPERGEDRHRGEV